MRKAVFLGHVLAALFTLTWAARSEGSASASLGEVDAPEIEGELLDSLRLPLIFETGDIGIREVPMRRRPGGIAGIAEAMCAPFYAPSERESDRTKDINLISVSGIKISFQNSRKRKETRHHEEGDLMIDVSHFKQPANVLIKEKAIIEAILACMGKGDQGQSLVKVKIIGTAKASIFSKLEGPLWSLPPKGAHLPGTEAEAAADFFFLSTLYLPLITPGGAIEIRKTPVKFRFEAPLAAATAFSAPVYATSTTESERKLDINLVSAASIGVTLKYVKPDGSQEAGAATELVIDLSHLARPKNVELDEFEMVQVILTCMRINRMGRTSNVKILGARDPAVPAKLEGPLWGSGDKLK